VVPFGRIAMVGAEPELLQDRLMDYTITAVDRSLRVLEVLAEHPGISITDIATLTGNTRSLVFRILFTLERRGYVIKDPVQRTYTLGYRPLYLGGQALDQSQLLRVAGPHLEDLGENCDDNINMLVRDGTSGVCIYNRQAADQRQLYARVGRRIPLHVGGGPKILLAFAPEDVQEEILNSALEAFTKETVTDAKSLRAVLASIRQTGINESHGEIDRDTFSVGGAIYQRNGDVIAALSIAGPMAHLEEMGPDFYRRLVRDACEQISEAVGWRSKQHAVV